MLYADVNVLIDETSKSGNKSLNHGEALQRAMVIADVEVKLKHALQVQSTMRKAKLR